LAPASIATRIAAHAASGPGRLAVTDGAARLTYGELHRQSDRIAAHLRAAGAGPEGVVALFFERSPAFVAAALGVLKAGAAYLPLDSSTPADRIAFILADAGVSLVLTHDNKQLPPGPWRVFAPLAVSPPVPEAKPQAGTPEEPPPDRLAYVIYTSGSTGRPKGVEITHGNLNNLIDWHVAAFAVTADDRAGHVAGLGFDAAVWEIWPHLAAGASLHVADEETRRSPEGLRDWLVAERVTISFVPTVLAEQVLRAGWPADTALRTMLTGADTLRRRPSAGLPFVLINNYGPTECTVVATSGPVAPTEDGLPSIGRPIANTTALILNAQLRPVPPGEAGELCLAGAHVGRGYRNDPALTARQFVMYTPEVRIYRTGDRARLLPSGEISFLGRLDEQVKIRGHRVEPGEVVACLDDHPAVEACAAMARDGNDGPQLVAYVVARGTTPTATELREHLASRLPDYMIPSWFVGVAALPVTLNGKIDRAALPAPSAGNTLPERAAAPVSGGDDVQRQIAGMVASLLGRPSVEPGANIFLLGGHSLLAAQLLARVGSTFGVKIPLRQLFTAPTVAALSAEVSRLTREKR
jgi:amino acid adenylation domain-containing protein